jgi:hypothetical protein
MEKFLEGMVHEIIENAIESCCKREIVKETVI